MNLFSDDHMSYEIDRDPITQPALSEMTDKALRLLSHATKNSEKGFFLMIEGSRIDMAGHTNDPATHVQEILAYQKTVEVVKKFVEENPSTVMISVSDHETGGLSVARQVGAQYPEYKWYALNDDANKLLKNECFFVKEPISPHRSQTFCRVYCKSPQDICRIKV